MEPATRGRLLIAEDEVDFRDSMAELLRREGYECICAGSLDEAVHAAQEHPIDLLLMDIRMPGNRGLDVARRVLKSHPTAYVIVLTGYPSIETAVEGVDLSVFAYLSKPVKFEDLRERVECALRVRAQHLSSSDRLKGLESAFFDLAQRVSIVGQRMGLHSTEPSAAQFSKLQSLSARESEVLMAVLRGYRVNGIAKQLKLSPYTVRNHLRSIFGKTGVHSQSELIEIFRPTIGG